MSAPLRIAAGITRAWVRLYTIRIPEEMRFTRRAEIDSDLWEHAADGAARSARPLSTAIQVLLRTCFGVADDVFWCLEVRRHGWAPEQLARRLEMNFVGRHNRWVSMFTVAAVALAIFMFGLVPTLTSYFRATGIPLPLPTRFVMGASALLTTYWWASLPLGLALFGGVIRFSKVVGRHDEEVRAAREALLVRWEPMLIVGLSLLVGALILAMFLPIFDVVQAMG